VHCRERGHAFSLPGPNRPPACFCSDLRTAHDTAGGAAPPLPPEPAWYPARAVFRFVGFRSETPRNLGASFARDQSARPTGAGSDGQESSAGAAIIEIELPGHWTWMIGHPVELADVLNEVADRSFRPRGHRCRCSQVDNPRSIDEADRNDTHAAGPRRQAMARAGHASPGSARRGD